MPVVSYRVLPFIIFFWLVGCSSTPNYTTDSTPSLSPTSTVRSTIKSAFLKIKVDESTSTISEVRSLVGSYNGLIHSIHSYGDVRSTIDVKIPNQNLEGFIEDISKLGEVTSKNIQSRDVTGDMVDIEAKLTNLKLLRDRFRKLLDIAKGVEEILKLEKEINRLQTEIDSIEGKLNALEQQVEFSHVDLEIETHRIYGPLGYIGIGLYWVVSKLFIIK